MSSLRSSFETLSSISYENKVARSSDNPAKSMAETVRDFYKSTGAWFEKSIENRGTGFAVLLVSHAHSIKLN